MEWTRVYESSRMNQKLKLLYHTLTKCFVVTRGFKYYAIMG